MPRVSKNKLSQNQITEINIMFLNLISQLSTKNEVEEFFENFLTDEEKIMLAKRLMMFIMILKGYQADDIQSTLHISRETIRTYKNQFIHKSKTFKLRIRKLAQQQKVGQLLKKINKLLRPIELIVQSRTNMRARAKIYNADFD